MTGTMQQGGWGSGPVTCFTLSPCRFCPGWKRSWPMATSRPNDISLARKCSEQVRISIYAKESTRKTKDEGKGGDGGGGVPLRRKPSRGAKETSSEGEETGEGSSEGGDVASAYSLGETLKESPLLNSTLMNAMRDYFGDDGREVQDYMKRPRNKKGELMFRVVVVGSGEREVETMKRLKESGVIMGLYYCADEDRVCDLEMSRYGQSATVGARANQEEVVRFAKWVVADAVFVGPEREGCINKESETELAAAGITVFPHDVSAAIADGSLGVLECLSPLVEDGEESPAEQLVE